MDQRDKSSIFRKYFELHKSKTTTLPCFRTDWKVTCHCYSYANMNWWQSLYSQYHLLPDPVIFLAMCTGISLPVSGWKLWIHMDGCPPCLPCSLLLSTMPSTSSWEPQSFPSTESLHSVVSSAAYSLHSWPEHPRRWPT